MEFSPVIVGTSLYFHRNLKESKMLAVWRTVFQSFYIFSNFNDIHIMNFSLFNFSNKWRIATLIMQYKWTLICWIQSSPDGKLKISNISESLWMCMLEPSKSSACNRCRRGSEFFCKDVGRVVLSESAMVHHPILSKKQKRNFILTEYWIILYYT